VFDDGLPLKPGGIVKPSIGSKSILAQGDKKIKGKKTAKPKRSGKGKLDIATADIIPLSLRHNPRLNQVFRRSMVALSHHFPGTASSLNFAAHMTVDLARSITFLTTIHVLLDLLRTKACLLTQVWLLPSVLLKNIIITQLHCGARSPALGARPGNTSTKPFITGDAIISNSINCINIVPSSENSSPTL